MKSTLSGLDFSAPPSSTGGLMLTVHTNNLRTALVAALGVIDAESFKQRSYAYLVLADALEPFKVAGDDAKDGV